MWRAWFVLVLVSFTVQLFHSLFTFTFTFVYFTTAHTRVWSHENTKIVGLQLNEKKSTESQTRLMSWYWKGKSTWRKDLTTYDSHPWIMFYFNWLVIIWRGGRGEVRLKLDVQGQGSRRNLDVDLFQSKHSGLGRFWIVVRFTQILAWCKEHKTCWNKAS